MKLPIILLCGSLASAFIGWVLNIKGDASFLAMISIVFLMIIWQMRRELRGAGWQSLRVGVSVALGVICLVLNISFVRMHIPYRVILWTLFVGIATLAVLEIGSKSEDERLARRQ